MHVSVALEQSAHASSARGDVNRYWSGHTLRLLMVLAGTLIKAPTFALRVVTGLPVKVWDNESTVPQVQRSPHRPIFVDTQTIQIADAVARCVREVGEDIRSRISRVWRSSEHGKVAADAARVLTIGGGAYYFAPLLREMLPHLEVPRHAE